MFFRWEFCQNYSKLEHQTLVFGQQVSLFGSRFPEWAMTVYMRHIGQEWRSLLRAEVKTKVNPHSQPDVQSREQSHIKTWWLLNVNMPNFKGQNWHSPRVQMFSEEMYLLNIQVRQNPSLLSKKRPQSSACTSPGRKKWRGTAIVCWDIREEW